MITQEQILKFGTSLKPLLEKAKLGSGDRFKKLSAELAAKGVANPDAAAAAIGRKKYGKKKFQKLAAKGK